MPILYEERERNIHRIGLNRKNSYKFSYLKNNNRVVTTGSNEKMPTIQLNGSLGWQILPNYYVIGKENDETNTIPLICLLGAATVEQGQQRDLH